MTWLQQRAGRAPRWVGPHFYGPGSCTRRFTPCALPVQDAEAEDKMPFEWRLCSGEEPRETDDFKL
jgi:hypothetical protein